MPSVWPAALLVVVLTERAVSVAQTLAFAGNAGAWSAWAMVWRREPDAPAVGSAFVPRSSPIDGFSLAYDRAGEGPPVLLLHGWPGRRTDFRAVVPLLTDAMDVVVPDLRGFGESDKHPVDPAEGYSVAAQARSVVGLMDDLEFDGVLLAGYDIGSRIAQAAARAEPERVRALVLAPPFPGVGVRVLTADAQREFWYQPFHRLALAERLLDGRPDAVRAYLRHFWDHWSGPAFALADTDLDALVKDYAQPGAFTASIAWYRAGAGMVAMSVAERAPAPRDRIAQPTRVLWPEHDPLFPVEWGDRLDEHFARVTLTRLPDSGHFMPLEAPEALAGAIRESAAQHLP
jgi:pimeloyl-ACP methyl ester carboxylesterase